MDISKNKIKKDPNFEGWELFNAFYVYEFVFKNLDGWLEMDGMEQLLNLNLLNSLI